jgi:3-phytase
VQYLQYEVTGSDGTLTTALVRFFQGGSGGQVEWCVSDEENGVVFIGEEPYGLWKYDAEPGGSNEGTLVDSVDGNFYADVEGVTLVNGKTKDDGFLILSFQGVSAYNIYNRAAPHEYRMTSTIKQTQDGKIDDVTNTDGVVAVGGRLNADFPGGVLVVHDDVNQEPDGSRNPLAAGKIVSLEKVLGKLLDGVDTEWNPRV